MASSKKKTRLRYELLYSAAKAKVKPNPDKSVLEASVHVELTKLILGDLDPHQMAEAKASAIIEALTKQPDDDGGGAHQLNLFGDTYSYNPMRLIKDDDGNIIEEEHATVSFKVAELARASANANRIVMWNNRKAQQLRHFQRWATTEAAKDRKAAELTWGNCIRETGVLRQKS